MKLRIRSLPGVLADVARLCGDGVAVRFAARFGDTKLHIPRPGRLRDDHPLVQTLGRRAAGVLAAKLGGQEYEVPTGRWSITHHQARLLHQSGWSVRATAQALSLRAGTVRNLVADLPPVDQPPVPVTIPCPTCGRVYRLRPAGVVVPAAPVKVSDADLVAAQPPLLRLAVETGALSVDALRRMSDHAGADCRSKPAP